MTEEKKEILLKWYLENGINDIIQKKPFNHFKKNETKKDNVNSINRDKKEKINMNDVYKNIESKYENDYKNNNIEVNNLIKEARKLANNSKTNEELKYAVENFNGLDIKKTAKNTVFSDGDINSKIMIIGEAPGNNEDIEGKPFCGESGKLLDSMFKSIGLKRENLYITNTLFWRPPANRTPTDEEMNICYPFVEKHIALINPSIIICVGATALKDLTKTDLTITKARKNIFEYTNQYLNNKKIKLTPLFHPSYLLRQSNKKKDALYDLLFIKELLK